MISILFATFLCADWWTVTDWSDTTGYDTIVNLNGTREPGRLILDAPDIQNWEHMVSLPGAQEVYDLLSTNNFLFAATGDDSGDVFYSSDGGEHWYNTANIQGITGVNVLFSPNDSTILTGCTSNGSVGEVALSSIPVTNWSVSNSFGWSVISFASGSSFLMCSSSDWNPKIYISYNGTDWQLWYTLNGYNSFIDFINVGPDTIVAISSPQDGIVISSIDGGASWNSIDTLNMNITDMEKDDYGNLFAGTQNGKVLISTNKGFNWTETTPIPNILMISSNDMVYNDGKLFIGAGINGNKGRVFFTKDNGANWDSTPVITNGKLLSSLEFCKNGFGFCGTNVDASIYRAGYFRNGYLISKPFFTGTTNESIQYGVIQWSDSLNNQALSVKVRTDTSASMLSAPPWQLILPLTNGDSITGSLGAKNGDCYIQYYVELNTQNAGISPVLKSISLEYSVDTIGPMADSAVAYDGIIQQNGIDDDDYVVIFFSEPTNKYFINKNSIDSILKLDSGSWGNVDTVYWNCESGPGTNDATSLTVELNVNSTIAIGAKITPDTVIKDIWDNRVSGNVKLMGTFDDKIPPSITAAFASDNIDSIQGIDSDDLVRLIFDQATDMPQITSSNINSILRLSNGHIWGNIDSTLWSFSGKTLTVFLDTTGLPSVAISDTIFPDSQTINDLNGNPCFSPRIIIGTFGDYGPVIDSAVAYDGIIQQNGIDSDDYVFLYFNEETNKPQIDSTNIDNVLTLNIGNRHTWNPVKTVQWNGSHTILEIFFNPSGVDTPTVTVGDTIYPDSITITDVSGRPCIHPVVLTGSFNPGVEESKKGLSLPGKLNLIIFPNPSRTKIEISYSIPFNYETQGRVPVTIDLFDITGRKVRTLVKEHLLPGRYKTICNTEDIKQGVYFVRITTPDKFIIYKLVYIK